ncbi:MULTISPECIES: anti-sigma factor [Micromonospora]|uniref:anti-sigma factor n=1 Tax=Micromonospora TaxID=1873 RepID=UPI0006AF6311|nr:anti-sigma factor [Micromonospora sp. NRRL B-16802]
MQHLDHDRLVYLALGESEAANGESTHLDTCEHCRAELTALQQVAGLGAETQGLADLPDPPEHIWQGIAAEISAAQALPSLTGAPRQQTVDQPLSGTSAERQVSGPTPERPINKPTERSVSEPTAERSVSGTTAGPEVPGAGSHWSEGRSSGRSRARRRGWSRWAATAVTAAAAAAVGVVGTVSVLRPDDPPPDPTPAVVAQAPLAAYGSTPPTATGDARVLDGGQLHLHVANLPSVPGYYEVWLINPTTMQMFSVGTLGGGSDALLPLPPNVDLSAYSVVDVSAEQYDNKPAHSGDSLLRGTLTG